MLAPKPIHRESIPRALQKAERYRLLNEPFQAESICRDVLAVDPHNQQALVCLILAITDMFTGSQTRAADARPLVQKLESTFDRFYYAGVVEERWSRSLHIAGYPAAAVNDSMVAAMHNFDEAQKHAESGNDDAILRWNACLRFLNQYQIEAAGETGEQGESLDDDVPIR